MLNSSLIYWILDYGLDLMFDTIEYNMTVPAFELNSDIKPGERYGCICYSEGDGEYVYYYACTIVYVDRFSVHFRNACSCTYVNSDGKADDIMCDEFTLADRMFLKFY